MQMTIERSVYFNNLIKSLCFLISVLCFSETMGQFYAADQEIFELPYLESCTKAQGNNYILDSIYEFINFGYYSELYRWYYQYNAQQQPDTVWRYYFNGNGEIENIVEIRTYNTAGQLLTLVRKQPDFWALQHYSDSTIIDAYTEEYEYNNAYPVHKTITERDISSEYVSFDAYYTYDDEHKLIHSTIEEYGNVNDYEYYYTDEDDLEYILKFYTNYDGEYLTTVTKYEYEKTDTTRQITRNMIYNLSIGYLPDTITHWYFMDRFYETYDQQGRRTSLMLIQNDIYFGEQIDHRIEYSWAEDDQLLHSSYYKWNGTMETGVWEEALRFDNTYDEYGNLLFYEKTYFDARNHGWETEESKTYYYTYMPSGLPANHANKEKLIIYPNPSEDIINIQVPDEEDSYFTIYNLYGVAVTVGRLENLSITISHLKPGIYIVEIRDGHSLFSGKFVKD